MIRSGEYLRAADLGQMLLAYRSRRAGATNVRKAAVKTILAAGHIDIIKGNEGEIATVYGAAGPQQKGVDSGDTLTPAEKARMVRDLARRRGGGTVAVMTGATDYLSDGTRTLAVRNGHAYLGTITGAGCVLGTTISAMAAAHPADKLAAALAALLLFEIAAERAALTVRGPGTFVPAFIDELYLLRLAIGEGKTEWLRLAKVESVTVPDP